MVGIVIFCKLDSGEAIGQAGNMFPEPKKGASKVLYVFIAVLVLFLIVGGVSWFYFNSKPLNPGVATPSTTPGVVSTDAVENASTTITTSLGDLDTTLAQIESDLLSTDDNTPTL